MQNYRNGKWVDQILSQRREDGLWGNFHTLSCPVTGKNYTTEQAIRRLYYLGYTAEDEVIQRVLKRMEQCIKGELDIDNYLEKKHDWVFFEKLMLAAWLRIFEPQNETALEVAYQWAQIVEKAFASGSYSVADDIAAFTQWKGRKPKSGFETGFGMFYHAALLPGVLSPKTEDLFLDYYLSKPDGMYYIYDKPLNQLPEVFASRKSSCYIAAIEVLFRYDLAKEKLTFVIDWINANRNENGKWDFGEKAKDGVYFPLSDRWDKTTRITDSTYRIIKLFGLPCYCGYDCSKCITYIATQTNDDDLRRQSQNFYKESFGLDIPLEKFYCDGGRSKNVFELCKECPFKKCCIERGIDSCSKCSEYPCPEVSDYQQRYVNKCNQLENEQK